MLVETSGDMLNIEVRCSECDAVMTIGDQYDHGSGCTVEVDPCEECNEED